MIIIEKTKSIKQPFKVRYTAPGNNKNDSHSENLTSKRNCWKNIYSMAKIFFGSLLVDDEDTGIQVWDKTIHDSEAFLYTLNGIKKKAGVRK